MPVEKFNKDVTFEPEREFCSVDGDSVLLAQKYYSVGGGFIEWYKETSEGGLAVSVTLC